MQPTPHFCQFCPSQRGGAGENHRPFVSFVSSVLGPIPPPPTAGRPCSRCFRGPAGTRQGGHHEPCRILGPRPRFDDRQAGCRRPELQPTPPPPTGGSRCHAPTRACGQTGPMASLRDSAVDRCRLPERTRHQARVKRGPPGRLGQSMAASGKRSRKAGQIALSSLAACGPVWVPGTVPAWT